MIKANHKKWAQYLFYRYIDNLMRKNFSNFFVANEPPELNKDFGLVLTPNHISWWDGFFAGHIEKIFIGRMPHIMMLEKQLEKYWFFSKVGAYSINPINVSSIIETANYTRNILGDANNSVIVYPQGEIEPFEKRPLILKKGLQLFIHGVKNNFYVVPVGFKIQHFDQKNPAVIARFGKPIEGSLVQNNFALYEQEFLQNLEELSKAVYSKTFYADLFEKKK